MLNAFRHHGVSRTTTRGTIMRRMMCSTPFGITEFRGRISQISNSERWVLNAFRHHGVSRLNGSRPYNHFC